MARASSPDSADSQWFICFQATPFLNGEYTAWGQVVEGMEFVDAIKWLVNHYLFTGIVHGDDDTWFELGNYGDGFTGIE
jgi:cyclophilin family peptidyl-prolyl cis-trans isomerase